MKLFVRSLLVLVLCVSFPVWAQQGSKAEFVEREIIPGLGVCTKREWRILDEASRKYADISFPKQWNTKSKAAREAYERRMMVPGILEKLTETYIKCGRNMTEFFPPQDVIDEITKDYGQDPADSK